MLNWFGRFVLAITALAPIAIAYAWAAYLQSKYLVAFLLALSAPVLVLLCYFLIIFAASRFEKIIVHPKAAEAADRESVALIVLYLIPLFTYKFTDLQWNVIIPSMVVLGIIVTSGYNFYFSPMLSVLGWHSYKITDQSGITYILMSKRELRNALKAVEVVQLTEYLLLETREK